MTPHFLADQNKTRLLLVFGFTVLLAACFQWYRGGFEQMATAEAKGKPVLNDALFVGVRKVKPAEVRQVLPESAVRPTLLVFSSRFCHDCQRLAPVLTRLTRQYPGVTYRKLDITEDQQKAPAILRAFKPVSVPLMVFIAPGGEIQNVLYNFQSPEVLAEALKTLEGASLSSPSPVKKVSR
jgi:thiol:disulfide interchange protein